MHDLMGRKVVDCVTQFAGVVTGVTEYLSGCTQALVVPRVGPDGKLPESQWFDVQRLIVEVGERVVLDNGDNPGCDRQAPKR